MISSNPSDFLVVCLCAAWCGTCREYAPGFEALATRFPEMQFRWVDIEDEASGVEDWEVENFPTLLIQCGSAVLFFGPMLPQLRILEQALLNFQAFSLEEIQAYVHGNPERASWQVQYDYRPLLDKTR